MNVYIPGIDRFSSDDGGGVFWWIVGTCIFASIFILLLFASAKRHRWNFGIFPSKYEKQLEHEPLKCLLKENTVPWFDHGHHVQDFTVEHNLLLMHWSRRKLKVEEWIAKAKQAMLKQHYTQAVAALDKALRSIEKHRPSFNKSGQELLQNNIEKGTRPLSFMIAIRSSAINFALHSENNSHPTKMLELMQLTRHPQKYWNCKTKSSTCSTQPHAAFETERVNFWRTFFSRSRKVPRIWMTLSCRVANSSPLLHLFSTPPV